MLEVTTLVVQLFYMFCGGDFVSPFGILSDNVTPWIRQLSKVYVRLSVV